MASYTREQTNRWNAKLNNGFELDFEYLLNHMPGRFCEDH